MRSENVLDHSARCICVPCSLKSGRLITLQQAANLLKCGANRARTLAIEGKLDRCVTFSPEAPYVFAESVKRLIEARKRRPPRTHSEQLSRWRASDRVMLKQYGITPEDWARLFESQAGRCPGCAKKLDFGINTNVDHCHATGRVRGLLCNGCNTALGGVRDKPEALRRLAIYLETR